MTDTTSETSTQVPATKPAAELADHVDDVGRAVRDPEIAIEELEGALDWLDGDEFPDGVRDLAAVMNTAAGEVHWQFDCGNFHDQVTELEILAGEEAAS
jgi:hypothetical protein